MVANMRHGIITPHSITGRTPGRVVNARSKKNTGGNKRIRLDKLLRSPKPKILIKRRLGGIGDVIMTTPLLKAIKNLIPHCELIYATDIKYSEGALKDVVEHCPYVDIVVQNGTVRDSDYDYSVDVTSTGLNRERSGTIPPNRIDMFAEEAGVDIREDPTPVYELTEKEIEQGLKELEEIINSKKNKDLKIIAIQARSNDNRRCWPIDHVQELLDILSNKEGYRVLLFDWGSDIKRWKKNNNNTFLIFDKKLNETARLIKQADVVVCPDSSMLHLAGALNKKTVTIFGPIPPESRINYYQNASAIQLDLPCKNCWYSPRCRKNSGMTLACLTGITPEMVEAEVEKKLSEELIVTKNIQFGKNISSGGQDPIILIRRTTSGLGDLIMTTPALAALKKKFPDKQIEVACKPELSPILQNNPNIDKLLDYRDNFNYRRYFMVIDISSPCAKYEYTRISSGKDVQKSRVEIFAEAMNVRNEIRGLIPEYYIKDEEKKFAKEFLKKNSKTNKSKIAIGIRSAEEYRDWPESNLKKLIGKLKKDFEIIILDYSRQEFYTDAIDAAGFQIRKAIAILNECEGLITVDTGLLHFAAALNIPTIALFGPIDYKARCKGYKNVTVISANLDCSPCWRNSNIQCKKTGFVKGNSECMKRINSNNIADIAKRKFK